MKLVTAALVFGAVLASGATAGSQPMRSPRDSPLVINGVIRPPSAPSAIGAPPPTAPPPRRAAPCTPPVVPDPGQRPMWIPEDWCWTGSQMVRVPGHWQW